MSRTTSLFCSEESMKESDDVGSCTHKVLKHRGAVRQHAADDYESLATDERNVIAMLK
jgi:hypothetical protein